MNPVDKKRVARSFARALSSYDEQAILQRRVADRLLDLLAETAAPRRPGRVLEIGCGTGLLTGRLVKRWPEVEQLFLNDLVPACGSLAASLGEGERVGFLAGDIEELALPPDLDLVVSSSTLHWVHDLAALLKRIGQALNPGGILAVALYGPDTLREIRSLTGQGLAYHDLAGLEQMAVEAGFSLLTATQERERLVFPSPEAVLRHLHETGVNALATGGWSRGRLQRFCRLYRDRFAVAGGVTLTYHPLYLVGRSP